VTVDSEVVDHAFATVGTHIPLKQGGGTILTLAPTSRSPGAPFWELAEPPTGFTFLGRFAVVPPQPGAGPAQRPSNVTTAVDDVYVRGADVIIVERTEGGSPSQASEGSHIDLGPLGSGQ